MPILSLYIRRILLGGYHKALKQYNTYCGGCQYPVSLRVRFIFCVEPGHPNLPPGRRQAPAPTNHAAGSSMCRRGGSGCGHGWGYLPPRQGRSLGHTVLRTASVCRSVRPGPELPVQKSEPHCTPTDSATACGEAQRSRYRRVSLLLRCSCRPGCWCSRGSGILRVELGLLGTNLASQCPQVGLRTIKISIGNGL